MIIPRQIHQTWKDAHPPPHIFRPGWMTSWKARHPDWDYTLWTDADNRRLIEADFPWFLETYDAYPLDIHRADAIRYFILYRFGGVYVDLDFECLRNLSPLMESTSLAFGLMGTDKAFPDAIPNAFLASIAGHDFWPHVFTALMTRARSGRVEHRTGPLLLKDVLTECYPELLGTHTNNVNGVRLIGNGRIYPIDWRQGSVHEQTLDADVIDNPTAYFPDAYCVTYWTRCWSDAEKALSRQRWRLLKRAFG